LFTPLILQAQVGSAKINPPVLMGMKGCVCVILSLSMIISRYIFLTLILFGCSDQYSGEIPEQEPLAKTPEHILKSEISKFETLHLKVGMNREQVEEQLEVVLGKKSDYSPYGNNLLGGTVQYREGVWILEVTYKSGTPAPWIINKDGIAEHYPPIDESVLDFSIKKI